MNLKRLLKVTTIFSLLSTTSFATDYNRADFVLTCKIHGTKQSFTQKESILPRVLYFSFKILAAWPEESTNYSDRKILEWTTYKIAPIELAEPVREVFQPKMRPYELNYVGKTASSLPPMDFLKVDFNIRNWTYSGMIDLTLEKYAKILELLGETEHPNFKIEVPAINWTPNMVFNDKPHFIGSVGNADGSGGVETSWRLFKSYHEFQAHYGEDTHDGLSYHIILNCQ